MAKNLRDLFLLRDDVAFLNHGSFGACPRPVFEEYQRLQRELESEPVDFLDTDRTFHQRMAVARGRLADFVGADRNEIVFTPNATTGLNIVARSLDLNPGDEILTGDHEYGALDRTWRFLCGKTGAKYVQRRLPVPFCEPEDLVEAIWNGVTDRTKVLFLSHITAPSGAVMPIAPLIARARDRGILTMIDGAHSPGQLDLDLRALGCDVYSGNCHKWLMSPKGSALLYVRQEMQHLVEPLVVSWGWEAETPGPSRFVDEQEWSGTRDPSAYLAVPAAIDFFEEHQWRKVRVSCRKLLADACERLLDLVDLPPLCHLDPWLAQMCAIPLPPDTDRAAFGQALREKHAVEVPITWFDERPWLRFSIQGYNTAGDVDRLAAAVKTELGR
ncbi:MAG: aminotransferase class V-fold PLP-dependent enzyme [bacterium]|nr:aminotransferase class V-fold PLP-dependent enzyme [bacterium]